MFITYIYEINENENVDAPTIKELLKTWENDKARKIDEFKLINDTINAMILPQIQGIQARQENVYNDFIGILL